MDLQQVNDDLSQLIQSENGCQYTDISDLRVLDNLIPKSFNFLHLNIRSFQRNKDSLLMLLDDLQEKGVIVHVVSLCETFLTSASAPLATLENYQTIHKVRPDHPGSGTSLLIHDSVHLVKEQDTPFTDNFESVAALVTFYGIELAVSEFYRPPNSDNHLFLENLEKLLAVLKCFKTSFVSCDQNYDLLKLGQHLPTCNYLNRMFENDYVPYILKPTCVTHRSSTLIDNIYVKSNRLNKNNSFIITDDMSDHFPCLLSYALKSEKNGPNTVIERHDLSESAILSIQQSLLFYDWT